MKSFNKFPTKYALKLFGVLFFIALGLITIWIWFLAFINGGTVPVYVDFYGEMYYELVMLIVTTPLALVGGYIQVKELLEA
jgi:hypothetical protein